MCSVHTLVQFREQSLKDLGRLVNRRPGRRGKELRTSSSTVYTTCWFSRRFWSTANIRFAPRRAFERPIMLATRSRWFIGLATHDPTEMRILFYLALKWTASSVHHREF